MLSDEERARRVVKKWKDEESGYWKGGSQIGTGRLTDLIADEIAAIREECAKFVVERGEAESGTVCGHAKLSFAKRTAGMIRTAKPAPKGKWTEEQLEDIKERIRRA